MNGLFQMDGPLFAALSKIGRLIVANVLWLLCCLPVVTVIPAATAFYYTVIKSVRRGRGYVTGEFFRAFRRTLGRGCLLTIGLILWFLALYAGWRFALANARTGTSTLLLIYGLLFAASVCTLLCIPLVFSRFELPLAQLVRLSFVMGLRYLYLTLPLAAAAVLLGWLAAVKLPIPCILFLPGLCCYGMTWPAEHMLLAYMPAAEAGEAETEWYWEKTNKFKVRKHLFTGKKEK